MARLSWCDAAKLDFDGWRYDDALAHLAAELADIAYMAEYDARHTLRRLGLSALQHHATNTGAEVWLMRFPAFAAVVFVGTNELRDWRINLDIRLVEVEGRFAAHAGFWRALQPLLEPINRFIDALPHDLSRLITGHSAGAGLAQLTLALRPDAYDQCYVLAPSRPGDRRLARLLNSWGVHRIASATDLVTWTPWVGLLGWRPVTYRHGAIHQLYRYPRAEITHSLRESVAFASHIGKIIVEAAKLNWPFLAELVSSHCCRGNYAAALNAIRQRNNERRRQRRRSG